MFFFILIGCSKKIDEGLYIGGSFTIAGEQPVNRVARWDGEEWCPLGQGMNGPVYAMLVYKEELYAGGDFTIAGNTRAHRIAKWNGKEWLAVGEGFDDVVYCMTIFENELYIGGKFTSIGKKVMNSIAKWNGENWSAVGSGIKPYSYYTSSYTFTPNIKEMRYYSSRPAEVRSLLSVGNELYVAGNIADQTEFNLNKGRQLDFAVWNGLEWKMLGEIRQPSTVYSLAKFQNEIYLGGFFWGDDSKIWYVAKWNGKNILPVGKGIKNVYALLTFDNELYSGIASWDQLVYKWNGTEWVGVNLPANGYQRVYCLSSFEGSLVAGGDFKSTANYIATYNGSHWSTLGIGTDGSVYAMVAY